MENIATPVVPTETMLYEQGANLLIHQNKTPEDAIDVLVKQGATPDKAVEVVHSLAAEINQVKKEKAKKDILYGALWCGGGTVATLANIGFIFWGAILFGGIQLVKGLVNYANTK